MYRLIIIISIALFYFAHGEITPQIRSDSDSLYSSILRLLRAHESNEFSRLSQIYFLGSKALIKYWEKSYFQVLALMHLLTPSGLHLSAILVPLKKLLTLIIKNNKYASTVLLILIAPLCIQDQLHSMRRVAIFIILYNFSNQETKSLSKTFFLTFFIDFLSLGFFLSPYSFFYSFIFWGSIISGVKRNFFYILFYLCSSQAIVCLLTQSKLSLIAILLGQIFTAAYCFIFPLLFLIFLCDIFFITNISGRILFFIHKAFYQSGRYFLKDALYISDPAWLILPLLPLRFSIILFFIFSSHACLNHPEEHFIHRKGHNSRAFSSLSKGKRVYKNKKLFIQLEKKKCSLSLANHFWQSRCRKVKVPLNN